MFFKKFKTTLTLTLLSFFIIPINALAYSNYLIAGGKNIGITLESKGIIIVGTYKVNNESLAEQAGLKAGDIITSINDTKVSSIDEMIDKINKSSTLEIKIGFKRNDKEKTTNLKLVKDNNIYKTGLYVKDSITGIGTLTFIDPETKMYGALGHEVTESNTGVMLELQDGKIYDSTVTSIDRSENGAPGSKNATLNQEEINGDIIKNTKHGIFGEYTSKIPNTKKYKVADYKNIKLGKAQIMTVVSGDEIKTYDINILKLDQSNEKNKNILFEITDEELLNKTGGVVQGMSGSPIIQNDFIIGAVASVVVNEPTHGYGILIKNMLEETEES